MEPLFRTATAAEVRGANVGRPHLETLASTTALIVSASRKRIEGKTGAAGMMEGMRDNTGLEIRKSSFYRERE